MAEPRATLGPSASPVAMRTGEGYRGAPHGYRLCHAMPEASAWGPPRREPCVGLQSEGLLNNTLLAEENPMARPPDPLKAIPPPGPRDPYWLRSRVYHDERGAGREEEVAMQPERMMEERAHRADRADEDATSSVKAVVPVMVPVTSPGSSRDRKSVV